MFQLIYASTPISGLTQTDAKQIAIRSRDKNRISGVTGVLLISGSSILQVLEGEEMIVRRIYQLILRGHQHTRCELLLTRHCDARSFPHWTMGFCVVDNEAD